MNTGCELATQSECRWVGSVIYTHVPTRSEDHFLFRSAWILVEIITRITLMPLATGTQGTLVWGWEERLAGPFVQKVLIPVWQTDRQSSFDGECVPLESFAMMMLSDFIRTCFRPHFNFPINEAFVFWNTVNSLSILFLCCELRGTLQVARGRQWNMERWEWKLCLDWLCQPGSNFRESNARRFIPNKFKHNKIWKKSFRVKHNPNVLC